MLKPFLRDSALYGAANMLARGIQILLVPIFTRFLRPEDYGVIDMMMVAGAFLGPVMTLEIASGLARAYGDSADPGERSIYGSTAFWFTAMAAAVLALVGFVGAGFSDWLIGPGRETEFRVAAFAIATQLLFGVLTVSLRFQLRALATVISSLSFTVAYSAISLTLVVWLDLGVIGVFWGQLGASALAATIAALASRDTLRSTFDPSRCREMLAYSAPLVLSTLGGQILLLGDRVVIESMLGLEEVGVYGIGARIAGTVGLLISTFATALGPLIFNRYKDPETPAQLARLLRMLLLVVLPVAIGFAIFAHEMLWIIVTPDYWGAANVIPLLTVSTIISGCIMFTPGMEIAKKTSLLAIVMVVTGVENLLLNVLLIPHLGVVGSAVATLISAATGTTANMIASQRLYPLPHRWGRIAVAIAIAAVSGYVGFYASGFGLGLISTLFLKGGIGLLACAGLAFALLEASDFRILRDRLRRRRSASGGTIPPAA